MPQSNISVEELVDRLLLGMDGSEEIKKRKPKQPSFRYLTDKTEIQAALSENLTPDFSVMKTSDKIKIVDEQLAVIGLGNVDAIENVLLKHQASKKFKK